MKKEIYTLIVAFYVSAPGSPLYGWNNQSWLGNGDRVVVWNSAG